MSGSEDPRNILVIRRDNIGDLVCTTPLFTALRARYPEARISALVNSYNVAVLAGNPDVDAVYSYTKAKHRQGRSLFAVLWERFRMLRDLRGQGVDLAILATPSPDRRGLSLARQVVAAHIRGADDGTLGIDQPIAPTALEGLHQVQRILKLAGFPTDDIPALKVVCSDSERQWARERLHRHGIAPDVMPVGVHISARKACNRWPLERHAELIEGIYRRMGRPLMLFWSPGSAHHKLHPGDDELAAELQQKLPPDVPLVPFPTTDLRQLVAGFSQLSALVCSDGGAMHLAAGLQCPIVCLFGYDGAANWAPWGEHRLLYRDPLADLGVEEVLQALGAYV